MTSRKGEKVPSKGVKEPSLRAFLAEIKKRHIIETLAAFVGGGWLILEFVDRLLVAHYHFPEETIDLAFITVLAALICTILWRWFRGTEKRPGNVKVEVLLGPLVIWTALAIDLNLVLQMAGIQGKKLLVGVVALCLGVIWVIFKLSQWAAAMPEPAVREIEISPPAPARPEKSIVVLPFSDLSPEKDQEYFCDGMTEEIITDLSHVRELLVISRNSAMTFKGTQKTTKTIAQELNVRFVLEGSVRKAGNDLRVAAQLIKADTDVHIWAEKYSGTLNDVFDIQEKVSRSIVDVLKLKLTPEEKRKIATSPMPDFYAYECYLKARYEIWKWTEEGLNNALIHLQKGLDIAGDNAVLLAGIGYTYYQYINTGVKADEPTMQKAEEYAKRALELDPEWPVAHIVRGLLLGWRGHPEESIKHFKRALAVDPNNIDALIWLSSYCGYLGKIDAALSFVGRLSKIEPLHFSGLALLGHVQIMGGRLGPALDSLRRACESFPGYLLPRWFYAFALACDHQIDKAYSIFNKLAEEAPDDKLDKLGLSLALALRHEKSEALLILQGLHWQAWARDNFAYSFYIAECYSLLDEKDQALDWLENSVNRGMINYPYLSQHDCFLTNIRDEPRFQKLMERVKYEWEHFEV